MVLKILNEKMENLNLTKNHIDISHRMGTQTNGTDRQIMVKFVSRITREKIMSRKKEMKGTNIFICEDLKRLNYRVLTSMHKNKNKDITILNKLGKKMVICFTKMNMTMYIMLQLTNTNIG